VATSPDVAWRVSANKCSKYQVVVKVLWQYSTGQVTLISWSAVHSQVAKSVLRFAFLLENLCMHTTLMFDHSVTMDLCTRVYLFSHHFFSWSSCSQCGRWFAAVLVIVHA
jgi:hypothetical protein